MGANNAFPSVSVSRSVLWLVLLFVGSTPAFSAPPFTKQLELPTRIERLPAGGLLISDYVSGRVQLVSEPKTAGQRSLHPRPVPHAWKDSDFDVHGRPLGVAWGFGCVFVGNETTGRVEVYSPKGEFLNALGEQGSIRLPNDIAIDEAAGQVLVLDAYEKVVKVFARDGTFLYPLTRPGVLNNPTAMTFDPSTATLLVSDYGALSNSMFRRPSPRILLFGQNGNVLRTITGSFARPQGLCLDGAGRLFVADSLEGTVQVINLATGALISTLGASGPAVDRLSLPLDVLYSRESGVLYVADSRNRRVAILTPGGFAP